MAFSMAVSAAFSGGVSEVGAVSGEASAIGSVGGVFSVGFVSLVFSAGVGSVGWSGSEVGSVARRVSDAVVVRPLSETATTVMVRCPT